MKKKEYEKPTTQVVQLKQQPTLLAGSTSNSASIEDYQDGGNPWNQ